jgi:flagellar FliJ protein
VKKFEFKLQKLLEIRQKKEDQERIELGKASGAYQYELGKKQKILDNIKKIRRNLSSEQKERSLFQLQSYDLLIRHSDDAITKLEVVIEEKRLIMQEHMDRYAELRKDRKVVETLKGKARKRYEEEIAKEEQKDLDEMGKNLYLKNKEVELNSEN